MAEGSPDEHEKTVGEILDDTDRAESKCLNGAWSLTALFVMLAAAGWLFFEAYFN